MSAKQRHSPQGRVAQGARSETDLRETQTALLRAAGGSANNVAAGRAPPVSLTALVSLLWAAQVFGCQAPPGQPQEAASCHPERTGYASSRNLVPSHQFR